MDAGVAFAVEVFGDLVVQGGALPDDDDLGPVAVGLIVAVVLDSFAVDEAPVQVGGGFLAEFAFFALGGRRR